MSELRKVGEKGRYSVRDRECIGRKCLALGRFETRGAVGGGVTRNTGGFTFCCMNRAYHGCPSPLPEFDKKLASERKSKGVRAA